MLHGIIMAIVMRENSYYVEKLIPGIMLLKVDATNIWQRICKKKQKKVTGK